MLIELLAQVGDDGVLAQARNRWAAGAEALPGSLRGPVMKALARTATAADSQVLWAALRATNDQEQRWVLLSALAADPDPVRARQLLDAALAGWLPPNVATEVASIVADEPAHAAASYEFVREHWPRLATLAGSGAFGARAWLLPGAADGLSQRAAAQRLREDQRRLAGPTASMPAETVAAAIEVRAALREREAARLGLALAAWSPAR